MSRLSSQEQDNESSNRTNIWGKAAVTAVHYAPKMATTVAPEHCDDKLEMHNDIWINNSDSFSNMATISRPATANRQKTKLDIRERFTKPIFICLKE